WASSFARMAVSAVRHVNRTGNDAITRSVRRTMPARYSTTPRVAEYIRLHLDGLSTAQIADRFKAKKNTVLKAIRHHGALRPALGRDVELDVAASTCRLAHSCYRMPGNHPYDLLVDGQRVDVKSA